MGKRRGKGVQWLSGAVRRMKWSGLCRDGGPTGAQRSGSRGEAEGQGSEMAIRRCAPDEIERTLCRWGPHGSPAERVAWGSGGARERNGYPALCDGWNGADFAPTPFHVKQSAQPLHKGLIGLQGVVVLSLLVGETIGHCTQYPLHAALSSQSGLGGGGRIPGIGVAPVVV